MSIPRRNAAKIKTLRQQGVLNSHPEAVTDPLFQTADFFDPQDLLQVKYEMLRRVEIDKAAITEAAAAFGLSRPVFYQAQRAVAQQGLVGLIPRKRGPQRAHKLTSAVLEFVLQQRATSPALTTAELIARIQQKFGVAVHRRTIERHLGRQKKNAADHPQHRCPVTCRCGRSLRAVAPACARRMGRSGMCCLTASRYEELD